MSRFKAASVIILLVAVAISYFVLDFSYFTPTNLMINVLPIFQQPYQKIPSNLDTSRLSFQLYTRENPDAPIIIKLGEVRKLKSSTFNYKKPTYFFTHGWLNTPTFPVPINIHRLILKSKDANVFLVDWGAAAMAFENQMLANAPVVGRHYGDFINWLAKHGPLQMDSLHMIGFSMGSHITGMAARRVKKGKPVRVTGIDPPGIFNDLYPERIRKGDAEYVEVIHTTMNAFGQKKPLGDADFYPNWGQDMPGCLTVLCNHMRAFEYYQNSIDNDYVFMSDRCKDFDEIKSLKCSNLSKAHMGGLEYKNASGVYYLPTTSYSPFYMEDV